MELTRPPRAQDQRIKSPLLDRLKRLKRACHFVPPTIAAIQGEEDATTPLPAAAYHHCGPVHRLREQRYGLGASSVSLP